MTLMLTTTSGSRSSGIEQLLATATAALEHDSATARACIARAAVLLRVAAADSAPEPAGASLLRGGLAPWRARQVSLFINDHLSGKIRMADLAVLVGLSPSHFFRAFRQTFGLTPTHYVGRQRIQLAQELMVRTQQPLVQIALSCGLCDQSHFTRTFRRLVGTSPRDWRSRFAAPEQAATTEQL